MTWYNGEQIDVGGPMKRFGWIVLFLCVLLNLNFQNLNASSPILIESLDDFLAMESGQQYQLTQDLDFSGVPIAPLPALDHILLDGQNHTLSNLRVHSSEETVGLFSQLSHSIVRNLRIDQLEVNSGYINSTYFHGSTGGLVGWASDSQFSHLYLHDLSVSGAYQVGGLIGQGQSLALDHIFLEGSVVGQSYVGGVIGLYSPVDPFESDLPQSSSTFNALSVQMQLSFDAVGGGVFGGVLSPDTLSLTQIATELVFTANDGMGFLAGEVIESDISLSNHFARAQVQPTESSLSRPHLIGAYYDNDSSTSQLNVSQVLILGNWTDAMQSSSYSPYVLYLESPERLMLEHTYYLNSLVQAPNVGALSEQALNDPDQLDGFNFETIWGVHPSEPFPHLRFQWVEIRLQGSSSEASLAVIKGSWVEPPIPSMEGYAFAGWFLDAQHAQTYTPQRIYEPLALYAKFNALVDETPPTREDDVSVSIEVFSSEPPSTPDPPPVSQESPKLKEEQTVNAEPEPTAPPPDVELSPKVQPTLGLNASQPWPWWSWWILVFILILVYSYLWFKDQD